MLSVSVFVPSESDGVVLNAAKRDAALDHVLERLSTLFGGATVYEAQGAWSNGHGIVKERVTVAKSYTDEETVEARWDAVEDLGRWLKSELQQESVLLSVEPVSRVEFL